MSAAVRIPSLVLGLFLATASALHASPGEPRPDRRTQHGTVSAHWALAGGSGDAIDTRGGAAVHAALVASLDRLEQCYSRNLLSAPDVAGHLSFVWSVADDGRPGPLQKTADSVRDWRLEQCVTTAVAAARPQSPPQTALVVELALRFERN